MSKKNIIVVGANGKMGSLLCEKLKNDFNIIKVNNKNKIFNLSKIKNIISLVIDFASAKSSIDTAKFCYDNGLPILIASTGQTKNELEIIKSYSKKIPMMIAPNLSIGIVFVKKMIDIFSSNFNYDISIHEKHHIQKKDSPSGTALMLKDFISKRFNQSISVTSERGGKEIGTHTIDFYFNNELISLTHQAFSREAFIDGALIAIDYLMEKENAGLYEFDNILNEMM